MSRRRLIWQLFPSYLLVTLVAIFAVAWYATYALRASWIDRIAADLEVRAHLVGGRIVRSIDEERTTWLQPLAVSLGTESGARITVLDETGAVLADSDELPKRMESHADRPEFQEALLHGVGRSSRASPTLGENMMYVAVAFVRSPLPTIIVRAALPLTTVDAAIHEIQTRIAFGAALSAIMSAMASLWISRRIARPLREMRRGAARFARGDLKRPLAVPRTEEIASLAEVLNQMAGQLDGHIAELERQRGEREAILASMSEGLVAVDTDERMLIVNRAAATLLGVDAARSLGRSVQEIIRNPDIQRLVKSALARDGTIEDAISFASADGRALEVKASVLIGPGGTAGGAVLVLNDVTHLRRLERVRSDFVANVSHELKTPITAIKGFVET
ncbi:MAG: HAMP domain-containing protein, partial [Myxococcales bacterium]|nr:HAMP domain-containing protein [Myxococcales bacterium]